MKWQKARQINGRDPSLNGYEMWVQGPPQKYSGMLGSGWHRDGNHGLYDHGPNDTWYDTNIIGNSDIISVRASSIELLPEFADDVPLITWEQFLRS